MQGLGKKLKKTTASTIEQQWSNIWNVSIINMLYVNKEEIKWK